MSSQISRFKSNAPAHLITTEQEILEMIEEYETRSDEVEIIQKMQESRAEFWREFWRNELKTLYLRNKEWME